MMVCGAGRKEGWLVACEERRAKGKPGRVEAGRGREGCGVGEIFFARPLCARKPTPHSLILRASQGEGCAADVSIRAPTPLFLSGKGKIGRRKEGVSVAEEKWRGILTLVDVCSYAG